jgi:hypothetical protein
VVCSQLVAVLRRRDNVNWSDVIDMLDELSNAKVEVGDKAGWLATNEEALALALEHADELGHEHLTGAHHNLGMAYRGNEMVDKALEHFQAAYDRSHSDDHPMGPRCLLCPVSRCGAFFKSKPWGMTEL